MIDALTNGPPNGAAWDGFTAKHFGAGVFLSLFGVSFPATAAISLAWEIVEDAAKTETPGIFPHPSHDSKQNALWDAAAMMGGWWAAHWIKGSI